MDLASIAQIGVTVLGGGVFLIAVARFLHLQDVQHAEVTVDPETIDDWGDAPQED